MAANVTNAFQFATDKVIGERSGLRLMEGSANYFANILKINEYAAFSSWLPKMAPIQKWLKTVDGAIYVNNFLKGVGSPFSKGATLCKTAYGCYNDEEGQTTEKVRKAFGNFLYDLNKTVGDGAAAAKFMGAFVPILAPHGRILGLFKSGCTLIRVAVDLKNAYAKLGKSAHDWSQETSFEEKQKKDYIWKATAASISMYAFSILLNGFGVVDTLFGESMPADHRMPPVAWVTWGMLATVSNIAETWCKEQAK